MLTKLIIDKYENNKNIYKDEQASYNTIIIEGCEYINVSRLTSHYTHKGNCKNPIHQKRCE